MSSERRNRRGTGGLPALEPGSRARMVGVKVPCSIAEQLDQLVVERGTTVSAVLRAAIAAYVEQASTADQQHEAAA